MATVVLLHGDAIILSSKYLCLYSNRILPLTWVRYASFHSRQKVMQLMWMLTTFQSAENKLPLSA